VKTRQKANCSTHRPKTLKQFSETCNGVSILKRGWLENQLYYCGLKLIIIKTVFFGLWLRLLFGITFFAKH